MSYQDLKLLLIGNTVRKVDQLLKAEGDTFSGVSGVKSSNTSPYLNKLSQDDLKQESSIGGESGSVFGQNSSLMTQKTEPDLQSFPVKRQQVGNTQNLGSLLSAPGFSQDRNIQTKTSVPDNTVVDMPEFNANAYGRGVESSLKPEMENVSVYTVDPEEKEWRSGLEKRREIRNRDFFGFSQVVPERLDSGYDGKNQLSDFYPNHEWSSVEKVYSVLTDEADFDRSAKEHYSRSVYDDMLRIGEDKILKNALSEVLDNYVKHKKNFRENISFNPKNIKNMIGDIFDDFAKRGNVSFYDIFDVLKEKLPKEENNYGMSVESLEDTLLGKDVKRKIGGDVDKFVKYMDHFEVSRDFGYKPIDPDVWKDQYNKFVNTKLSGEKIDDIASAASIKFAQWGKKEHKENLAKNLELLKISGNRPRYLEHDEFENYDVGKGFLRSMGSVSIRFVDGWNSDKEFMTKKGQYDLGKNVIDIGDLFPESFIHEYWHSIDHNLVVGTYQDTASDSSFLAREELGEINYFVYKMYDDEELMDNWVNGLLIHGDLEYSKYLLRPMEVFARFAEQWHSYNQELSLAQGKIPVRSNLVENLSYIEKKKYVYWTREQFLKYKEKFENLSLIKKIIDVMDKSILLVPFFIRGYIDKIQDIILKSEILGEIKNIDSILDNENLEKTHPEGSTATFQSGPGREARQHKKINGVWVGVPQPPKKLRDTENATMPARTGAHHQNIL